MSSFDPARIVPSTRDLHAALGTRRRSLALVPLVTDASELARLEDLVASFAVAAAGPLATAVATATRDVPLLCLAPCRTPLDCQRARYFGADGVCLAPASAAEWTALAQAARSMRMMPLCLASDPDSAAFAEQLGARALLIRGDADGIAVSERIGKQLVLAIDWSARAVAAADLAQLVSRADAVIVPQSFHSAENFAELAGQFG